MIDNELRLGEWLCNCKENRVRSKSCLKCLRCGTDKPDPVTLGRACYALGMYLRCLDIGKTPAEAMQEALEADVTNRQGR